MCQLEKTWAFSMFVLDCGRGKHVDVRWCSLWVFSNLTCPSSIPWPRRLQGGGILGIQPPWWIDANFEWLLWFLSGPPTIDVSSCPRPIFPEINSFFLYFPYEFRLGKAEFIKPSDGKHGELLSGKCFRIFPEKLEVYGGENHEMVNHPKSYWDHCMVPAFQNIDG